MFRNFDRFLLHICKYLFIEFWCFVFSSIVQIESWKSFQHMFDEFTLEIKFQILSAFHSLFSLKSQLMAVLMIKKNLFISKDKKSLKTIFREQI